jgi:hypothetical protein
MIFWKMMVLYADYMLHLHSQEHPKVKVVDSCNGKNPGNEIMGAIDDRNGWLPEMMATQLCKE